MREEVGEEEVAGWDQFGVGALEEAAQAAVLLKERRGCWQGGVCEGEAVYHRQ
jgi:hypothetical protein